MPHDQTFLILGASGDLTARLLLPGLASLADSGQSGDLLLIGSSRVDMDEEEWRGLVRDSVGAGGDASSKLIDSTFYVQADVTVATQLKGLLERVEGELIIYFALPPEVSIKACEALREIGCPPGTRLAIEKPFGRDEETAAAFNELLTGIVPESQIFRVDHFLGLSTVLNIVGLRFANRVLEPVLNCHHVESVEIIWDEDLALEGRAGYYDRAGALIDMIQSHLLQVTAVLAMEPPPAINAVEVRDGTARVLRATSVRDGDPVRFSRRARYTAGEVDGRALPSYQDEEGVDPDRETETLAEVTLEVNTWRWAGVPFLLRSGKALGNPRKEAIINFRKPERTPDGFTGTSSRNRLRIGLGFGADTLRFELSVNGPGDPRQLELATMETELGEGHLSEYGEVLKGVLDGNPTLSVRGDAAVECWRIIAPVRKAWSEDLVPLEEYPAGSDGPAGWPDSVSPGSVH